MKIFSMNMEQNFEEKPQKFFLLLLFFSQLHLIPCASPPFILQRRIMLLRRIDITVSQNICDEVNIAGFTVQIRAVGAAEFMWCDLF